MSLIEERITLSSGIGDTTFTAFLSLVNPGH
jgi:hypothetical protein